MGNINKVAEFNARHREQQKKQSNIKLDVWYTNRAPGPGEQITLCKVPAHIVVKENEEADKAAKQAIDIPGIMASKNCNSYLDAIFKRHH